MSHFLDVAYVLLVDEYQRLGANLTDSLERTREYSAGYRPNTAGGNTMKQPPVQAAPALSTEEAENDAALAQLELMMAGVGGRIGR